MHQKVLFIMIMYNFTDRVRGEGEIPECSERSRPEQPPESDAGKLPPRGTSPIDRSRRSRGREVESAEVARLRRKRRKSYHAWKFPTLEFQLEVGRVRTVAPAPPPGLELSRQDKKNRSSEVYKTLIKEMQVIT